MTACWRRGLYAVTDVASGRSPRDVLAAAQQVLAGGAVLLQYRDKVSPAPVRRALGRDLLSLCRAHGVPLIVNDDVELAAELGADGVHLGKDDASVTAARTALGDGIIGVSCYNELSRAEAAQRAGADYVAFGRFFVSATKPGAVQADVNLLHRAKRSLNVPVVAIGGVTVANAPQLLEAGADLLAVVQGLFGARDPTAEARQFAQLFDKQDRTAVI